jgi:hypothetical protein
MREITTHDPPTKQIGVRLPLATCAELEAMVDAHNKAVGPHASQKNVTDIVRDAIAEMLQRKKRR